MGVLKILAFCSMMLSNAFQESDRNSDLTWFKAPVNSLYDYDKGNLVVGLGISARAFYLDKKQKNYDRLLVALKKSLKSKKPINIGYISADDSRSKIILIKD